MRNIRIHCTVTESQAGSVLVSLAEQGVTELGFDPIESRHAQESNHAGNGSAPVVLSKPVLKRGPGRVKGRSAIPEIFAPVLRELKGKKKDLTVPMARQVMKKGGWSAGSFYYALTLLLNQGLIRRRPDKAGAYEII